jgi:tRNA threonylcarbamoyladenosine biosynthesis protein TsaB
VVTVLGIDTFGTATSVALVGEGVQPRELRENGCAHNELVLDMLARLLAEQGIRAEQLHGIGVLVGPGMFTSLRVGLCVAKAVSETHHVPVKGINTLEAFAYAVDVRVENSIVALDANKGQVYAAVFSGSRVVLEPCVLRPAGLRSQIVGELKPGRTAVTGNAADLVLAELRPLGIDLVELGSGVLGALPVGNLALESLKRGLEDDPATLAPFYIRQTDAELARDGRPGSRRRTRKPR